MASFSPSRHVSSSGALVDQVSHGPGMATEQPSGAAQKRPQRARPRRRRRRRRWTKFELNAVLALICKGEHLEKLRPRGRHGIQGRGDQLMSFTSQLNEALHGDSGRYEKDIQLRDVSELMAFLAEHRKGAFQYIDRQGPPYRLTRAKKMIFARELDFDGSLEEWMHGGRREKAAQETKELRENGVHERLLEDEDAVRLHRYMKRAKPGKGCVKTITTAPGDAVPRYIPSNKHKVDSYMPRNGNQEKGATKEPELSSDGKEAAKGPEASIQAREPKGQDDPRTSSTDKNVQIDQIIDEADPGRSKFETTKSHGCAPAQGTASAPKSSDELSPKTRQRWDRHKRDSGLSVPAVVCGGRPMTRRPNMTPTRGASGPGLENLQLPRVSHVPHDFRSISSAPMPDEYSDIRRSIHPMQATTSPLRYDDQAAHENRPYSPEYRTYPHEVGSHHSKISSYYHDDRGHSNETTSPLAQVAWAPAQPDQRSRQPHPMHGQHQMCYAAPSPVRYAPMTGQYVPGMFDWSPASPMDMSPNPYSMPPAPIMMAGLSDNHWTATSPAEPWGDASPAFPHEDADPRGAWDAGHGVEMPLDHDYHHHQGVPPGGQQHPYGHESSGHQGYEGGGPHYGY
ncbi:hypothetical protein F5Y15DRAFT_421517 [Xylariaceae sp. FL0016]|nr:hypothetical protein F5Y15DRAFT_421517 [Xylariaceae sp. FL0016]